MPPKKTTSSPVKDAKVTKKAAAAPKKTTASATKKTPIKKNTPTKTPTKATPKKPVPPPPSTEAADGLKFVKAKSTSKSDNDVQDFATYTVKLYLEASDEPIAEFEGAMPNPKDVHWCSETGPVFHVDISCMGKDGHKFVCDS